MNFKFRDFSDSPRDMLRLVTIPMAMQLDYMMEMLEVGMLPPEAFLDMTRAAKTLTEIINDTDVFEKKFKEKLDKMTPEELRAQTLASVENFDKTKQKITPDEPTASTSEKI